MHVLLFHPITYANVFMKFLTRDVRQFFSFDETRHIYGKKFQILFLLENEDLLKELRNG